MSPASGSENAPDSAETKQAPDHAASPAPKDRPRRHTLHFVVVFVIVVLFLLGGYRYIIDTRVNDVYLFTVAKNTAWVLGRIGHTAELETGQYSAHEAQRVRAELAAWDAGRESATPEEIAAASAAPLSDWDRYRHRLAETRRERPGSVVGPRVAFILRPGLTTQLFELEQRLRGMDVSATDASPENIAQRRALEEEIQRLRREVQEINMSGAPDRRVRVRGYTFHFIVVPECGAIEVMAIFFAAVVAFPTTWRKRLLGNLVGVPIMYGVNVFRLSCLAVVGALDAKGEIFKFVHEYVWQSVYIIFVVAVWLVWIEFVVRRK
jgi:exosortase/archaeosortase family protein